MAKAHGVLPALTLMRNDKPPRSCVDPVDRPAVSAVGDPRKPEPVVLGSVIRMSTVEHCNALINDARAKGAKLVCGEKATSTMMRASLLDFVTPAMNIYHEETFGRVKCIVRVNGVE